MNDIYSFYQLISKYQIEIPIIQRDYAQGRDNTKAADVRKSIIKSIIKVLVPPKPVNEDNNNQDTVLSFDFVYGRIDGQKFIPFDGQQRLTTLFLFHKYIFEKCQTASDCIHTKNCVCKDILKRFSYATRQSSREFCEKLVEKTIIPDDKYKAQLKDYFVANLKEDDKEKEEKARKHIESIDNWIYRFITNQSWFYPDWKKDPTVMGMLTMLDEIHNQLNQLAGIINFRTLAEKLTNGCNCPITFHFVDMGEHRLSDETYVKMNARGKQLTPFENFKASLEQYIKSLIDKIKTENLSEEEVEEKKKYTNLLNRFNGKLDESKKIYTGIDGRWLDLFWKVANEGKTEKELPDTLMMSFFNRHFMNVWRCWYANNLKTEIEISQIKTDEERKQEQERQKEYKILDDRIANEFPLHPTKDQFITFEIYQGIIENCGIDNCLTPLFNICDALSDENNRIENDCQAVWNRNEMPKDKWDLFQRDAKDETYKSRTAFYALLKYYENPSGNIKTTLAQWMRVVWNIIENSTIDSSETYHAALRLIERLSAKSHDIYKALAYEFYSFKLGNQYHAQDQVQEEIAKARQILDEDGNLRQYNDSCKKEDGSKCIFWEDIITKAEKTAFFKGAIRFLFQDAEGSVTEDSWKDFDTKWENAQKYFDKKGVNDKYKVSLTKSLVVQCDNWNDQLYNKQIFNPNASTWKGILCSATWRKNIHEILVASNLKGINTTNSLSNDSDYIRPLLEKLPYKGMIEKEPDGRFRWHGCGRLGFYRPNGREAMVFDWGDFKRNQLLNELIKTIDVNNDILSECENYSFWWGWEIRFRYNGSYFIFYETNNVYLMNKNWNGKRIISVR